MLLWSIWYLVQHFINTGCKHTDVATDLGIAEVSQIVGHLDTFPLSSQNSNLSLVIQIGMLWSLKFIQMSDGSIQL